MDYFRRVIGFAFQRSLLRIDIFSAVLTALAPAVFYFSGKSPSDSGVELSLVVVGMLVVILLGRLGSAPYYIWGEDQKVITSLKSQLGDPNVRAKVALEEELINSRRIAVRFIAGHKIWHAVRDGRASVTEYDFMHGCIAHLRLNDPEIAGLADEYADAHDELLWWLNVRVKSGQLTLEQARSVPAPDEIVVRYQNAAIALERRVSLKV